MPTMLKEIEIAAEKEGGLVALSRRLKIKHQALYSWKRVPADKVLEIEAITGISRHDLRPDVFGVAA